MPGCGEFQPRAENMPGHSCPTAGSSDQMPRPIFSTARHPSADADAESSGTISLFDELALPPAAVQQVRECINHRFMGGVEIEAETLLGPGPPIILRFLAVENVNGRPVKSNGMVAGAQGHPDGAIAARPRADAGKADERHRENIQVFHPGIDNDLSADH